MTPSRWARFGCGVWMQGEDAAISALDWGHKAVEAGQQLPPTCDIYLGLDIGWRWDTTAVVPAPAVRPRGVRAGGRSRARRSSSGGGAGCATASPDPHPPRDGSSLATRT
jgi:hypothetical protein